MPFVAAAVTIGSMLLEAVGEGRSEGNIVGIIAVIAFTTVGALIEDRRPGQVVGRICLAAGLLLVIYSILVLGAVTLDAQPGRLPAPGAALAIIAGALSGWSCS